MPAFKKSVNPEITKIKQIKAVEKDGNKGGFKTFFYWRG
jgi:hypothetical protein